MCNACIFTENIIHFATAQFWCGLAPDGVGIPAVTINSASVLCDVAHPATDATDPHENRTSRLDDWRPSPVLPMLTVGWFALFTCITHTYVWMIGAIYLYYLCLRLDDWRPSPVLPMLTVGWLALFTCITYAYGWMISALHLYYLCLRLDDLPSSPVTYAYVWMIDALHL
jgi:hypothetical protein